MLIRRALHGYYRRMALSRLAAAVLWSGALTADVLTNPTGRVRADPDLALGLVLGTGALASLGAVAAWSHHHDDVLDWMRGQTGLRRFARYLHRTAANRGVGLDVPGVTEGVGVLAMGAMTAWTTHSAAAGAPVTWSLAFTMLLLYFPFSQYVIDPAWYAPALARRAGAAWFRALIPLAVAGAGFALFGLCAPEGSGGPGAGFVVAGLLVRVYADVGLVNALLGALPDSLHDQRKDLADAVSSVVHSKVKNELRILGTHLDLDSQPSAVQSSWHSLVHQVERLRRHPFREDGRAGLTEIVEGVRFTCRALAADSSAVDLSAEGTDDDGPLRATDLDLLEIVLTDLCANAVREANRLRLTAFGIRVRVRTEEEGERRRVTVTVEDDGDGFDASLPRQRRDTSLAVLDRRLQRRGGRIAVRRTSGGGARVQATWLAM